jgi:hypothetical protein
LGDTNDALGNVDIADHEPDDLAGASRSRSRVRTGRELSASLPTASRHLVASGLVMRNWTEGPFDTEAKACENLQWQFAVPVIEKL